MPDRTGGYGRLTLGAAFAALSCAAVIPIFSVRLPAILDYPNHLARMHILAVLPGDGALARYYRAAWTGIPDLAMDAVVPPLAAIMPVETAMRIFLASVLIALAGGCWAVRRSLNGGRSLWPLSAFLLLYNRMLLWGFLNYLAGVALALWALAGWIAIEHKPTWARIAVGIVLATIVYLAHLAAFGCYAIAILAFSATPASGGPFSLRSGLRAAWPAAISLTPAAALFLQSPTSGASVGLGYGNLLRKLDLPVSIFDNYNRAFDGATFAVVFVGVLVGLARGAIAVHPRLRWSLIALIAAFFALPSRMLTAAGLDHRLPVAIAFVFTGAADWGVIRPRIRRTITAALLLLFVVRLGVVETVWVRADRDYATLFPAFATIPFGGTLAVAAPAEAVRAGGVPLLHFPTLATIGRDAFVATLFADPSQQPLAFTELGATLQSEINPAALWRELAQGSPPALAGYDRLMIVDPRRPLDPSELPGRILFDAPRLVVVDLSTHSGPAR
jgi:hypothetical protein